MNRRSDGASEADIAACENAIGRPLPSGIRERLATENGWVVDDSRGATSEQWRFLPVLDRTDRKSRVQTAEDIAWHTAKLRGTEPRFADAVVVARGWSETYRLLVFPGDDVVYVQRGSADAEPIDASRLGVRPTPPPGSRPRSRAELPAFRYHPDPVATGSIVESPAAVCPGCGEARGWAYATTPYGHGTHHDICPWCIADGTAATKLGASFIDVYWLDDDDDEGAGQPAPEAALDELAHRTPGFASYQQEVWQHCHDEPCAFTGAARADELAALPAERRDEFHIDDDYVAALRAAEADGEQLYAIAWAFRCLHDDELHLWMDVA